MTTSGMPLFWLQSSDHVHCPRKRAPETSGFIGSKGYTWQSRLFQDKYDRGLYISKSQSISLPGDGGCSRIE
eukprot:1156724-Pelagomonas_calceolata.AAC.10